MKSTFLIKKAFQSKFLFFKRTLQVLVFSLLRFQVLHRLLEGVLELEELGREAPRLLLRELQLHLALLVLLLVFHQDLRRDDHVIPVRNLFSFVRRLYSFNFSTLKQKIENAIKVLNCLSFIS